VLDDHWKASDPAVMILAHFQCARHRLKAFLQREPEVVVVTVAIATSGSKKYIYSCCEKSYIMFILVYADTILS
jgi:hypothetical protein